MVVSPGWVSWGPPSRRSKCNAPVGQVMTTSAIWSAVPASTFTQGRLCGWKTSGKPRKQFPTWIQSFGSHKTEISSFWYTALRPAACVIRYH